MVFQLSNNDTFVQKSMLRQLTNLIEAMNGVRIEVVTHSHGIDLLLKDCPFRKQIEKLERNGVEFLICENTIRAEKLDLSELSRTAKPIPAGVAHIVRRQSEGWSYIKAGY